MKEFAGSRFALFTSSRRASLVLAVGALLLTAAVAWLAHADPLVTFPLRIKGHTIRAEVADTDETRRLGLMYRTALPESSGMLFVYERPGAHGMWMKNTLVPLSVAFLDADGRILNIEDMAPQTETVHSARGQALWALEMNQGWFAKRGIRPGDRVEGLRGLRPAR
jgi:uncharacterized membrane protein (UPF0127 family)